MLDIHGVDVRRYELIDSTNNEAKRLIQAGAKGPLLLVADSQSAGRGRQGKSFYSPPGTGLYMTLAIHHDGPLSSAVTVTSAAAVAVCRAVREVLGIPLDIKWVNDLYFQGKKCCGILVEAVEGGKALVIGIGVNLQTEAFPPELSPTATSLHIAGDQRAALAAAITRELLSLTADLDGRSWLSDYRAWSIVPGREIRYWQNGQPREARAMEIDDSGALWVQHPDGSRALLQSGEITLRMT